MDSALEDQLVEAFPKLYRDGAYCECRDGWFALIWRLSVRLQELISQLPEAEQKEYFAMQFKEKYGQLRFYPSTATDEMLETIDAATDESGHICEICGAPGTIYSKGWVMTRCPLHASHREPG
jgi:hypothetical protein